MFVRFGGDDARARRRRSRRRCASRWRRDAAAAAVPPSPSRASWPLPAPSTEPARSRPARAGGCAARSPLLGPAFVACIAYVDPGNFATNIAGGAKYGYLLLWVLLAANLMAMLIQNLSAKIGIATGSNLPELCREHFPRPVTCGLWVQAELIAMATDLAEFVGAAIALNLLFGVPLFAAGLITAVVAFAILALQRRGYRRFELAIVGMLGVILLGFLYDTLRIGFDAGEAARGLHPELRRHRLRPARHRHPRRDRDAARHLPALGADAGPHPAARRRASSARCCASSASTCSIAMGLAGLVNMSMLIIAASLFHTHGLTDVDTIEEAHSEFATARRRRRRARVRARAAGLGPRSLERRHLRRPGRHAGLHRPHDPAGRCGARSR